MSKTHGSRTCANSSPKAAQNDHEIVVGPGSYDIMAETGRKTNNSALKNPPVCAFGRDKSFSRNSTMKSKTNFVSQFVKQNAESVYFGTQGNKGSRC